MTGADPRRTCVTGAPARPDEVHPGDDVRYVVEGELGAGGMGRVLRVQDRLLGRIVARKVMKGDPSSARALRFWREAAVTAGLEHPAIVPVYDAGQAADGAPWYDMRLVDGRTMEEAIAAAPDLAARLALVPRFLTTCQAIAWAHDHGVVHRDLKPANVLLGHYGETWVIDWGIATRGAARDEPDAGDAASGEGDLPAALTRAGDRLGTPAYYSPEAARGAPLDRRADVWGLGAILHELLTGRPPWGDDTQTGLAQRAHGDIRAVWPVDAPAALVAVAERCLATDPDDRYVDAAAVAGDIAAWLDGRWVQAYRYPLREAARVLARRHRATVGAAAASSIVVIAAGLMSWQLTRTERDRALAAEAILLEQQALRAAEVEAWLEAGPLAERAVALAGLADRADARGVLASAGAGPRPRRVASALLPVACRRVVVAPDGVHAACEERERLSLWTLDPVRLSAVVDGGPNGAAWSGPDTLRAVVSWRSRLLGVDGQPRQGPGVPGDRAPVRVSGGWATAELDVAGVWWDDGNSSLHRPCGPGGRISLAASSARRMLAACVDDPAWVSAALDGPLVGERTAVDPRDVAALAWSPDGARVLAGARDGRLLWLDAVGAPLGGVRSTLPSVRSVGWASDGTWAWAASDAGALQLIDPSGGPSPGRLPASTLGIAGDLGGPWTWRADPGGTRLDRWTLDGGGASGLRASPWGLAGACASPDGLRFAAPRGDGALDLWGPNGGPVIVPGPPGVLKSCAFTPDGRRVAAGGVGGPVVRLTGDGVTTEWPAPDLIKRVATTAEGLVIGFTYTAGWIAWRATDGVEVARANPGAVVVEVAATPVGACLHAAWSNGRLTRWDPSALTFTPVAEVAPAALAVHPDAGIVTVEDGQIVVRALVDGRPVRSWPADADVQSLAADGAIVAAGTLDGRVLVWTTEGASLVRLQAGSERVSRVLFAGSLLLSAGWDGTLRVWPVDHLLDLPSAAGDVSLAEAMVARPR